MNWVLTKRFGVYFFEKINFWNRYLYVWAFPALFFSITKRKISVQFVCTLFLIIFLILKNIRGLFNRISFDLCSHDFINQIVAGDEPWTTDQNSNVTLYSGSTHNLRRWKKCRSQPSACCSWILKNVLALYWFTGK